MKIHVKMKFNKIDKTKYLIKFYDVSPHWIFNEYYFNWSNIEEI